MAQVICLWLSPQHLYGTASFQWEGGPCDRTVFQMMSDQGICVMLCESKEEHPTIIIYFYLQGLLAFYPVSFYFDILQAHYPGDGRN